MMKLDDISVGQHVWVIQSWTNFVEETEVTDFVEDENGEMYAKLHSIDSYGTMGRYADDLFESEDAARDMVRMREEAAKDIYRGQIKTPEDLANFCYNETVCPSEEYTDWEAMAVAKEKAKEFGIDLSESPDKVETVEDLVCYCYNNCVAPAEEYTDEDARKYAAEKAAELGVDLDPESRGKTDLTLTDADLEFAEQMELSEFGL